ncbi:MAG: transcriptional repressor [Oscillospiraceae bacterium]|nr:transcriptional repressor [Oscillospiraceae bacterium]
MKQNGGYKTKQKEKILQYLTSHPSKHITAQEISMHMNAEGTPIGTATIYRYLDQLVTDGTIRKYIIDSRTGACFEYLPHTDKTACERHFHLKCMQCEKLYHVTCEHLCELELHILEHHGFQIDQSKTVLYGICETCRNINNINH